MFCVIRGNYRNFMRSVFTKVKVIVFLVAMLFIYATPLVLMLITTDF